MPHYDDFTESLLALLRAAKAYYSEPKYNRELSHEFWAAADAVQAARFAELRALCPKKDHVA